MKEKKPDWIEATEIVMKFNRGSITKKLAKELLDEIDYKLIEQDNGDIFAKPK